MPRRTRKFQSKAKTLDSQVQLRQRFIETGKALLKEAPGSEPSLRKIAEIEGYSPSALYRYFATKAELMYAIREDYLIRSVAYAQQRIEPLKHAEHRLSVGFEALVMFWVENPEDFRHVYSYRTPQDDVDAVGALIRDTSNILTAREFCVGLVRDFFLQQDIDPDDELISQLTDAIVVATHGVVAIPLGSPSIRYCPSELMARITIQAFVGAWRNYVSFIKSNRLSRRPTAAQFHEYLNTVGAAG
ncbi:TetR/AcrR family transcriptional regulator [Pusillimonas sp. CC-YST705]|uniref:TetR/AcrR family transcriptional regulator n=1 Tax=Mesopusillimonas faecipullorum TaxID=2755040 RepID=A0ABS8CED3_9BURK|nr:TetR/AcrR family transcriptional regulator [Mesopusillimonas faecipullorum]MCB5364401.1 TetR/AcrR family transcriptional regulator [Mesopusillimonas faecipullorum]